MNFEAKKLATMVGVLSILLGAWAMSAQAQQPYNLTGNARFQIGDGLPIPIRGAAAPNGGVHVGGGFSDGTAVVQQKVNGTLPMTLTLPPGLATNPAVPINLALIALNPLVFQVNTTVTASFPVATKTFKANGRNGAATVRWCPGDGPITASGDPNCAGPATPGGTGGNLINGRLTYTKALLGSQFGGNMGAAFGGTASVALNIYANNVPSTGCGGNACKVAFALASPVPNPSATSGATFGQTNMSNGNVENPGQFTASIANDGKILSLGSPLSGSPPGPTNKATSYFAPWTTGQVKLSVTTIVPPETFTITGSDMRVNGIGSISLVSGTIATRAVSGGNANRGWLNFTISKIPPTPSMSPAGLLTLISLLGLASGYTMKRRRSNK